MKSIALHFTAIFLISLAFYMAPEGVNGAVGSSSSVMLIPFTCGLACAVISFSYRYTKIHSLRETLLKKYAKEGCFPARKPHLIYLMTGAFFAISLGFIVIVTSAIDAVSVLLPVMYGYAFIAMSVFSCFFIFNHITTIFETCGKKRYFQYIICLLLYVYLIISMFSIGVKANLFAIFMAFAAHYLVKGVIYAPYYRHSLFAKFKMLLPNSSNISGKGFLSLIFSNDIKSLDTIIRKNISVDTPEAKAYLQHCIESGTYGWSDLLQRLHPSQKPVCLELMSR